MDQDQTMLCVFVSGVPPGVSLDCGRGVYQNVFAQSPILFSTQANTLRSININSNTNNRILSFHGPPSAANRLLVVVTPAQGVDFFVDGVDRAEYKARIKHMSLFPRPGYMGPSPPGFVEQIMVGMRWIYGTSITTTLRVHIANTDLSQNNVGHDVYMVTFLSSKRLIPDANSLDWQWIVCGRKTTESTGNTYGFCKHEIDPDNPNEQNHANPFVLDGNIIRLNGERCCQSCYNEYDWMPDCAFAQQNPRRKNLYDNVLLWTPFLNKQAPDTASEFHLYTYFTTGQSTACQSHNCNEAHVYRDMPQHLAVERTTTWDNTIDFLPGTRVAYEIPVQSQTTATQLYRHTLGFVEMNAMTRSPPAVPVRLDIAYNGHTCRAHSASSLECSTYFDSRPSNRTIVTTNQYENVYAVDIRERVEKTIIMPYIHQIPFAKTIEVKYCCQVRPRPCL